MKDDQRSDGETYEAPAVRELGALAELTSVTDDSSIVVTTTDV